MATQTNTHFPQNPYSPSQLIFGVIVMGGASAAAAALFTAIPPVGGAIFGVTSYLSSRVIDLTLEQFNCCPDNPLFKIGKCCLSLLAGIAAGAFVATAAGFPITVASGAVLTIAAIGTAIATILTLGSCLCSSAIATGTILALGSEEPNSVRV